MVGNIHMIGIRRGDYSQFSIHSMALLMTYVTEYTCNDKYLEICRMLPHVDLHTTELSERLY